MRGRVLDLLPAVYRERDARADGKPGFLESLLTVIAEQLAIVDADLDQLYDDLFIETCDAWVVPYIGDLVAVTPGAPTAEDVVLTRAAVADAIALRRRKGTAAVLEQLAHDITNWPALAVEMFQRLAVTPHLQHVVRSRGTTLSLRSAAALEHLDRSFDTSAHTLDVRRIGSARGRYNVPNVAVMVWRDRLLTHTRSDAASVDTKRYRFSAIGIDQSLATRPPPEVALTHQATSLNVPGPLTRRMMAASPGDYYGEGSSVAVWRAGEQEPVDAADVVVVDLGDSAAGGTTWSNAARLRPEQVAIDPQLGRLAFAEPQAAAPRVSFVTTAASDVGGSEASTRTASAPGQVVTTVRRDGAGGASTSLAAGLLAAGGSGTVAIADSATYADDPSVTVAAGAHLRVVGAAGRLPLVDAPAPWIVTLGEGAVLTLEGLVVSGGPLVVQGRPDRVEIADCTLVPGRRLDPDGQIAAPVGPSLVLELDADWQTEVRISGSITGPLRVGADGTTLSIVDSIVDSVRDGLGRSAPSGAPARIVPALRSPTPLGALALPAESTTLLFGLGTDPQRLVDLGSPPANADVAAALLQPALAGTGARALADGGRVVIVGDGRALAVAAAPGSDLATELGLTGADAQTLAVRGGPADVVAASAGGALTLSDGSGVERTVTLAAGSADLTSLADRLQAAINTTDPTLADVVVGVLGDALLVVPADTAAVTFSGTGADATTAWSLGLVSPLPAIAASAFGTPGASLSLDRCTVFGDVAVTAIGIVSDSIVTGLLRSERRQTGCVQYSWISPGSSPPRQHACQPATPTTPPPAFVSRHFALAGYGRLRRARAGALVRGASDGFEMGAMARLRQTQSDDNLRRGIAEFLRFGLEAGVLDGD